MLRMDVADSRASLMREDSIYPVERILKSRIRRGQIQYFVKWSGFSTRHNTWEPESNILDRYLIMDYKSRHQQPSKKRRLSSESVKYVEDCCDRGSSAADDFGASCFGGEESVRKLAHDCRREKAAEFADRCFAGDEGKYPVGCRLACVCSGALSDGAEAPAALGSDDSLGRSTAAASTLAAAPNQEEPKLTAPKHWRPWQHVTQTMVTVRDVPVTIVEFNGGDGFHGCGE